MASPTRMAGSGVTPYTLESGKSRFLVRASATGLLAAFGHNPTIAIRGFTGEAWFSAEAPEKSSLRFEIAADSLAVTGEVNEKDRREMERAMREEVLETDRYPEIRFESSGAEAGAIGEGMYRMKILGKLTLHGVERDVEVPCNIIAGSQSLRATGDFTILQTDYRIKLITVAGGALKLKNELKFTFDIVAQRKHEDGDVAAT